MKQQHSDFSTQDKIIGRLSLLIGFVAFVWLALDAVIDFAYAFRAETLVKMDFFLAFLRFLFAIFVGAGVYFGCFLFGTLIVNFVIGMIEGIREGRS